MKLTRPSDVRALLERLAFVPSKALGQNFLIDGNILGILLDAADITKTDTVAEVGPGLGVLTAELLERAGKLLAFEKDDRLADHLRNTYGEDPRFELHHGDAVHVDWENTAFDIFAANLPYSVGSRILFDLFRETVRPKRIVVTVQKEVADRLGARPGTKDYGLLTVCAQAAYAVKTIKVVKPTCFLPPPRVDSAIVRFERLETPRAETGKAFRTLVKTCFSKRRKTMGRIFRDAGWELPEAFDSQRRPETLDIEEWGTLAEKK